MHPNGYQFLDSLSITIRGKVDRRNLLNRDLDLVLPSLVPSTDVSIQRRNREVPDKVLLPAVTNIFREVLKLPKEFRIVPTDNLFKLGGQSILLLRPQAKIKRKFKTALILAYLFQGSDAC